MFRLMLALAFALLAVSASAQTDPRTNTGGRPVEPVIPHSGGVGEVRRFSGQVQVGERAPDFELPAADGKAFRLKLSRGVWRAVFFTNRRDDFDRINDLATTLDSLQVRTIVVCPEKEHSLAGWKPLTPSHLTALADEHGEISALYGLWDVVRSDSRPGLFLLDPQDVVRLALLGQRVGRPSLPGLVQTAVEAL